jgi:hypothetical protein
MTTDEARAIMTAAYAALPEDMRIPMSRALEVLWSPVESGTLRGDYERMAREWWGTYPRTAKNLAALLARVADEERARIVAWLEMRDGVMYLDCSCYRNAAEEVANREYER